MDEGADGGPANKRPRTENRDLLPLELKPDDLRNLPSPQPSDPTLQNLTRPERMHTEPPPPDFKITAAPAPLLPSIFVIGPSLRQLPTASLRLLAGSAPAPLSTSVRLRPSLQGVTELPDVGVFQPTASSWTSAIGSSRQALSRPVHVRTLLPLCLSRVGGLSQADIQSFSMQNDLGSFLFPTVSHPP